MSFIRWDFFFIFYYTIVFSIWATGLLSGYEDRSFKSFLELIENMMYANNHVDEKSVAMG